MKFVTAFALAMVPTLAWAQQTPTPQSSLPTLQQVLDQKASEILSDVVAMKGQITQDNNTITTLSQQLSEMATKNQTLEKQVGNLQAQLDAATKGTPATKP